MWPFFSDKKLDQVLSQLSTLTHLLNNLGEYIMAKFEDVDAALPVMPIHDGVRRAGGKRIPVQGNVIAEVVDGGIGFSGDLSERFPGHQCDFGPHRPADTPDWHD